MLFKAIYVGQKNWIKENILKQSEHKSFLEILIALKCYLTNNEENAWYIFKEDGTDQAYLLNFLVSDQILLQLFLQLLLLIFFHY